MKHRTLLTSAALACALSSQTLFAQGPGDAKAPLAPPSSAEPASTAPDLLLEQYTLENGLTVMLSVDHELPSVATHLVYLVGSGHERKGRTGFAHLFEHLMFQGSAHYDHEYFDPFEPIGARTNGTTSSDRTVYYEQVPRQYAELALWMESDRMRSLLPVLTQEKLDNQREVVKNERRQRYEITPYGMAFLYMDLALYPDGHPYQHPTIGSHEDLTEATLGDVQSFFKQYYVPANTGLVVVGDFDKAETKKLIEKYFGDMPSGERAPAPHAERPVLSSPKHWVAKDDIQLPRVYFAWTSPALFEPGDAELDLLSNILTSGKTSRLFKSLVYDQKLAKDVYAYQMSQKLNGVYVIQATAAPGTDLDVLAAAIEKEVALALANPPEATEMLRARNDYKKDFYHRLETYESRASLIGSYFLHLGRGDGIDADFDRYVRAHAIDVQQVGKKYLDFGRVVRLDFVPGDKSAPVVKLEEQKSSPAPKPDSPTLEMKK